MKKLRGLMSINAQEHAPPLVAFVWDRPVLTGVLESLAVSYVLFTAGRDPAAGQADDVAAGVPVGGGPGGQDTAAVAERGEDASWCAAGTRWPASPRRSTAARRTGASWPPPTASRDPRRLQPGQVLTAPRLSQ